jgi:hypothetical protein
VTNFKAPMILLHNSQVFKLSENRKWLHYMVDRFIDIRLLKINNSIFNIFSLLSVSVVTQDSTDRTLEKTRVTRDAITVFTG